MTEKEIKTQLALGTLDLWRESSTEFVSTIQKIFDISLLDALLKEFHDNQRPDMASPAYANYICRCAIITDQKATMESQQYAHIKLLI